MSNIVLSHELAQRVTLALRSGHLPPTEFQLLAEDILGDQRVATLRASIAGAPDSELIETIDLKRRYLAMRYHEWLGKVGA